MSTDFIRPRPRLLLAGAVAVTGVVLAWRSFDRNDDSSAAAPPPATPAHVEARLKAGVEGIIEPTADTVTGLVSEARRDALSGIESMSDSPVPLDEPTARDLAEAFAARLAAVVAPDFNATLSDLVDRGWPQPTDDQLLALKRRWERKIKPFGLTPFAPDQVEVRSLGPGAAEGRPPASLLNGYRLSSTQRIPGDTDGRPRLDLAQPDVGLVELRLPARLEDAEGETQDVLLAFWFTWDRRFERWRWISTHIYSAQDGASFPTIPPL